MKLINADLFDVLPDLPENSVDAVICDPPYSIGLLNHAWDKPRLDRQTAYETERSGKRGYGWGSKLTTTKQNVEFMEWTEQWAALALRALKPGGYILAFGAARTYHWLACGMETAGFEARDSLHWVYLEGLPKSWNYPRSVYEGERPNRRMVRPPGPLGTALKPAHEPIALMSKPRGGLTFVQCYERFGTGFLNIGDTHIPTNDRIPQTEDGPFDGTGTKTIGHRDGKTKGRYPANFITDGSDERIAKYFHCSKPSKAEKEAGLDHLPSTDEPLPGSKQAGTGKRVGEGQKRSNTHPTVKPIRLMRWLVRLTCPKDGVVLDPFMGSGTTGIAAVLEDRKFLGVEKDPDYFKIAQARIRHHEPEIDYDPFR